MACTTGDIIELVEELAPPHLAEEWDNAGLQVGSPRARVEAVLVSLDADAAVIAEARERGAGLLVCHHPPIFRPLRRISLDEPGGVLVREALAAGVAVYAAHTSLDASPCGVNAALAAALELEDHRPLSGAHTSGDLKLVTFLPHERVEEVSSALFQAGAGRVGDYAGCSFRVEGRGTFTPGPASRPAYGAAAGPSEIDEVRLEVVVSAGRLKDATAALLSAHPYEEPAYDIYYLHGWQQGGGPGRVGDLREPVSLEELLHRCRAALEAPAARLCGDSGAVVSRVAVCGGSGGKMAPQALQAGAQVLVTGDVSHHEARDARAAGLAVIDAGHYETERPVVAHLAALLAAKAEDAGLELKVLVSQVHTCPWSEGGVP